MEQTIQVGLGERSYPITIGTGIFQRIGAALQAAGHAKRYAIISDDRVASLYGRQLQEIVQQAGLTGELIVFPQGEASKRLATIEQLASRLAAGGFDRKDGLIALGGGVTGDMTGFLAAIYMRGIPFVQIPTTLLAQVDSSVGGKTGVDLAQGKNLVGAFYQPRAVFIDTEVLRTLPEEEFFGGMAEVIKYGAAIDAEFFAWLDQQREAIVSLDPAAIVPMIRRCCELKAMVVEQDEREGGLRRILNFGHTIGHAVEAASGYRLIHGYAVAIGMRAVAELAARIGVADPSVVAQITRLLRAYHLPTEIPADQDRAALRAYLSTDKKTVGGRIFFVLPERIGTVRITDQVGEADIAAVLSAGSLPG
ncbi:MAG: 3-dehydroquinate synthase [Proteobacteria bacterium]|nr:3-dehydroquinate synthase [Pseudomonadota bacterium]